MLAAIRPAGQDFPVLLHVVGATLAFGGLLGSVTSLALARGDSRLLRLGYFSLLLVTLPGWALMWAGGEWIYHKQGWNTLPSQLKNPTWLQIGFVVGDYGGLLFIVTLIAGWFGIRRLRDRRESTALLRGTMIGALALALSYAVAVFAMTGKPGQAQAAGPTSGQVTATVMVTATEFKFTLSKTSVPHGNVAFMVTNVGKIAHDFSINGKTTALISPGKSTKITVALKPGAFIYVCTVPGHAAAGMKGTLTVT